MTGAVAVNKKHRISVPNAGTDMTFETDLGIFVLLSTPHGDGEDNLLLLIIIEYYVDPTRGRRRLNGCPRFLRTWMSTPHGDGEDKSLKMNLLGSLVSPTRGLIRRDLVFLLVEILC